MLFPGESVGTHRAIETRDYKKIDSDEFLNDLVQQPWDLISLEPNPTAMWDAWKTLFMEIVDKHAPLKTNETNNAIKSAKRQYFFAQLRVEQKEFFQNLEAI